jgi:hypothetical protein
MGEDSDSDAICLDADGLRLHEDCIALMLDEADGEGKQICKVCKQVPFLLMFWDA